MHRGRPSAEANVFLNTTMLDGNTCSEHKLTQNQYCWVLGNVLKAIEYAKLCACCPAALPWFLLTSGLCWGRIHCHESGHLSPLPTGKAYYVPMLILTLNDCLFWCDCLLFCFAGCKGRGEFFCPVKSVKDCQICKSDFDFK